MIRKLEEKDIKLGCWILRNDLVSSRWLEDKILTQEKLESFIKCWNQQSDKSLFKIIL